jgi:hypothetical protein
MNERILELAMSVQRDRHWTEEDIERFAQLIIADAINTVERRFMGDLNREDMEVRRCVADLKAHFGVER